MVHALDTDAPGTDLLVGRILLRPPGDSGVVITAVMNPDGQTGYGTIHKGQPPSTILFSFTEGQPMYVTETIPADPRAGHTMVSVDVAKWRTSLCLPERYRRVRQGGRGNLGRAFTEPRTVLGCL